jgi:SH3 domain-containing protein
MGVTRSRLTAVAVLVAAAAWAAPPAEPTVARRFQEAGEAIRAGDYVKGTAIYRELAASGSESASLYWNWAQAASARGAVGEALWALVRGRELEPGDAAVRREVERLREAANLDPAEMSPDPLASLALLSRRFHLGLLALAALALSVAIHVGLRLLALRRRWRRAAVAALAAGLVLAALPLAASFARPAAVVLRRGAPLLESASPTADALGALREGEVVPILAESGDYLRVEDSSGARGWAHVDDLGRLGRPPRSARITPVG